MSHRNTLTTTVTKIAPMVELTKRYGIDATSLLGGVGLDATILNSPDNRITLEKYHALFVRGTYLTGDRFFGLHAGELFTMMPNILGYIMMNCLTVGEALKKYTQYQKLTDEIKTFDIIQHKDKTIIGISIKDDELDKDMHLVDYNLAGILSYCRTLTRKHVPVVETRFRHPAVVDHDEYVRIFNSRLTFLAERNALIVTKDFLEIPILQSNRELLLLFEKHINEILKRLTAEETYTDRVKRILVKSIKGESPSIAETAQHCAMSVRSLQNKLKDEGATYSAIFDSIRKEMALEYLKDNSVSIAEISFLLGFSEPSAFHRSFKRWTRGTPSMFGLKKT